MITLPSSSHQLIIKLSINPATECHCVTSYRETTDITYDFSSNPILSNGTTGEVMLYGSSVGSSKRLVEMISIYNPDVSLDVDIIFYDGTTEYILMHQTLAQYETLTYNDKYGWGLN